MTSACDIDVMRADSSSHLVYTREDTKENLPFHVAKLPGRGHALVATRDIGEGQTLFCERPYVSVHGQAFLALPLREQPCSHCGNCVDSSYVCSGGCLVRFCSAVCEELEGRVGHQFLCGAHRAGGAIDTLMREPPRTQSEGVTAHSVVLVLQVFARIAKLMEAGASCADSQIKSLQGFHLVDYVRCIHAIRCGLREIDEQMFNDLIAPAYIASRILPAFELVLRVFAELGDEHEAWGVVASERSDRARAFCQGDHMVSPFFMQQILGTFATNNLQVVTSSGDESLMGTGLYKMYSKMNHSCSSNVRNVFDASQRENVVCVVAARDIRAGEEICSSYLHAPDEPRRERQRALRKYLFVCTCERCENEQGRDSDSD